MPIKNLTEHVQPRFPRLGKLKKGAEKTEKGFGPDLDHFRFVSDNPEIEAAFYAVYPKEPRVVRVYIPHPIPSDAFQTWCEIWSKTGLVHRCDGETMSVWQEGGKYYRGAKPCAGGHKDGDYLNDSIGRLDVIIPELVEAGFVGYVTMETHSKNDILSILSTLQAAYESRHENPLGLKGILFNLRRVQESISTPGFGNQKGKRSRVDKWLVKIEPAADWVRVNLELARAQQMNQLPAGNTPALPTGEEVDIDPETGEIMESDEIVDSTATDVTETQPATNGNGSKPAPRPVFDFAIVEAAANMVRPSGARFGDSSPADLVTIMNHPQATAAQVSAATTLLLIVEGKDWDAWEERANEAESLNLDVRVPSTGITWGEMYKLMTETTAAIEAAKQPA